MSTKVNNMNMKNIIKWAIIFLAPLVVMMIPTTESFTMQQKKFLDDVDTSIQFYVRSY